MLSKTSLAYLPAGTDSGSPIAILLISSVDSASKSLTFVPLATTNTKSLVNKVLLVSANNKSLSDNAVICFSPADINTSQGAPSSICCCKAPDAPKLTSNFTFGSISLNFVSNSAIASCKDAAADIFNVTVSSLAVSSFLLLSSLLEHPTTPMAKLKNNPIIPNFFNTFINIPLYCV